MKLLQTRTRPVVLIGCATLLMLSNPITARAEGLLTGFVGAAFGGDTDSSATTFGVGLGATAGGIIGFELDVATTSNNLGDGVLSDSSITTAMGNILIGAGGTVRPYLSGGVGLIRSSLDLPTASVDSNDFGANVGAGVIGFVTDQIGIRGDVRYFRTIGKDGDILDFDFNLGNLEFWRGSAGVVFRW